mgnify:CR=1 FL=1
MNLWRSKSIEQSIADTAEGVWIAGLPKSVMIITVGQDFVSPGQEVKVAEEKVSAL